jgi:hypothetical protein
VRNRACVAYEIKRVWKSVKHKSVKAGKDLSSNSLVINNLPLARLLGFY